MVVLDALGVVYPQYWEQDNYDTSFCKHLNVLKEFYGEPKWVEKKGEKRLIPAVLDKYKLESEQPLFKMAMVSNSAWAMEQPPQASTPHIPILNPWTKLWRQLDANSALSTSFPKYIKLAEIAMVDVLGSMEDERAFSSLTFLKDKLRNQLDGDHLGIVVGMHGQSIYGCMHETPILFVAFSHSTGDFLGIL
jgi:hypothetical protein